MDHTKRLLSEQVHTMDRHFLVDRRDKHYRICQKIVYLLLDYSEKSYQKLQILNRYAGCGS